MSDGRDDFLAGARAVAPILLGIAPFGLVAGAAGVNAGLSVVQTVAMSVVVFAGASQLAAIDLVSRDAPVVVAVATALVINLRLVMYSASIAPHFRRFSAGAKWLAAYVLTDHAYALSVTEYGETTPETRSRWWYYFGAAATLWVVWQVTTVLGALLGARVPDGLSLEFAVPLTFMALLFHALDDRATAVAAVVGALVGVVAAPLPFNFGLVAGALVGVVAGAALELRRGTFPTVEGGSAVEDRPETDGGAAEHTNGGESR
ncbi:AzlC family ABC transporter permease [Halobium salinum]|uniref:AzlC family ABC transporter permease n=1 Tax=Halobium salinum TaxID=1364940 RepID=A0ABD5PHC1_9EURY